MKWFKKKKRKDCNGTEQRGCWGVYCSQCTLKQAVCLLLKSTSSTYFMTPLIVGAGLSQHHYCVITEKEGKKERGRKRQLFQTDAQTLKLAFTCSKSTVMWCWSEDHLGEFRIVLRVILGLGEGTDIERDTSTNYGKKLQRCEDRAQKRKHLAWGITHSTVDLSCVSEHFTTNSQKSWYIMVYICQHEEILIGLLCPASLHPEVIPTTNFPLLFNQ